MIVTNCRYLHVTFEREKKKKREKKERKFGNPSNVIAFLDLSIGHMTSAILVPSLTHTAYSLERH